MSLESPDVEGLAQQARGGAGGAQLPRLLEPSRGWGFHPLVLPTSTAVFSPASGVAGLDLPASTADFSPAPCIAGLDRGTGTVTHSHKL